MEGASDIRGKLGAEDSATTQRHHQSIWRLTKWSMLGTRSGLMSYKYLFFFFSSCMPLVNWESFQRFKSSSSICLILMNKRTKKSVIQIDSLEPFIVLVSILNFELADVVYVILVQYDYEEDLLTYRMSLNSHPFQDKNNYSWTMVTLLLCGWWEYPSLQALPFSLGFITEYLASDNLILYLDWHFPIYFLVWTILIPF